MGTDVHHTPPVSQLPALVQQDSSSTSTQESQLVSGLVPGLVSPVLESEEMKPNPMCVFRCLFLVSWKSLSTALKALVISGRRIWVL